jgi:serine/threonine protein phosphatase 1
MADSSEIMPLAGRAPTVPEGIRIYAVGDVHGRLDLLRELEALIDDDARSAAGLRVVEVMLGDYIDRGPDSSGVIDHLIARGRERELVTLRGNHDALLLDALAGPRALQHWCMVGGLEALASYGIEPESLRGVTLTEAGRRAVAAIPPAHADFIRGTGLYWHCGDYLFVHAGLRPGVALEQQSEDDMLWIRDEFLGSDADFGMVVVHGHTPAPVPEIRSNRIGIDTKAWESGVLTCLVLEGTSRRFLATG